MQEIMDRVDIVMNESVDSMHCSFVDRVGMNGYGVMDDGSERV